MKLTLLTLFALVFVANIYLVWLFYARLRRILTSFAWGCIMAGFVALFFIAGLGCYLAYVEPVVTILMLVYGILMFVKAILLGLGFTIFRYDLEAALKRRGFAKL